MNSESGKHVWNFVTAAELKKKKKAEGNSADKVSEEKGQDLLQEPEQKMTCSLLRMFQQWKLKRI